MHHARLQGELNEILDCIHNGWPIPDRYYPRDVDRHGDRLLNELGVKHLHLDGRGSDIIVYLAEFDTWVELLEINTHVHLESEPRGKELKGRFRSAAVAGAAAAGAVVAMATAKAAKLKSKKKGRVTNKNSN